MKQGAGQGLIHGWGVGSRARGTKGVLIVLPGQGCRGSAAARPGHETVVATVCVELRPRGGAPLQDLCHVGEYSGGLAVGGTEAALPEDGRFQVEGRRLLHQSSDLRELPNTCGMQLLRVFLPPDGAQVFGVFYEDGDLLPGLGCRLYQLDSDLDEDVAEHNVPSVSVRCP